IDISITHSEQVYDRLKVTLTRDDIMGESAYNHDLAQVITDLKEQNLAVESEGAQVVFLDELADKKGNPSVFIVQKSGGGYLYSTTDLAACRHRSFTLKSDRIIIFTDARQALHFKQVQIAARKGGFLRDETVYQNCQFVMMMGADGKPFKTRTGGTIKLAELLGEAVERAENLIAKREHDLTEQESKAIALKLGMGAVKFADLSKSRTSDYIFSWDSMLSFDGATAPYLQYAYTRTRSIFRKAELDPTTLTGTIEVNLDAEKALAIKLLQFEEVLDLMVGECTPHVLCGYLIELASLFMSFYEACPILKDGVAPTTRNSRLMISQLVSRTLATGLDILGIEVMEKM
ncbi:MAG: arginine--tRNA ligase, partial [Psychrosphaera sp.]|nr:arginine--tRNA ligase [Psychrosphaera sp.]